MPSVSGRPDEEDLDGEFGGDLFWFFGLTSTTGFLKLVLLAFLAVFGLLALVLPVGAIDLFMF